MGTLRSVLGTLLGTRRTGAASSHVPAPRTSVDADPIEHVRALVDAGRLPEALAIVDAAMHDAADLDRVRVARAEVLRAWGRTAEALRELERCDPGRVREGVAMRAMAWLAAQRGRSGDAVTWWKRALDAGPGDVRALTGLGSALLAAGDAHSATRVFEDAARSHPEDRDVVAGLAQSHVALGRHDAAEAVLRRALAGRPDDPALLEHLAVVLSRTDRHDEAFALFARAGEIGAAAGSEGEPFANLGVGLCQTGRLREGVELLERELPLRPNLNGHLQIGPALLALGEFREGWRQYEHRWLVPPLAALRADYGVPQWSGQPLDGRTILVRAEQGIGDVFQFARYLPRLKALGARVIFQPLRGMDAVAKLFPGVDHVVREGERLPDLAYFVNLMSLPLAFGTTVETIPCDIPYLAPDPAHVAKWAARFAQRDRPLIGLAWAGRPEHARDRYRSLDLNQLMPVLGTRGVRFVSMQKGPAVVQAESVPEAADWIGLGPELDELDDATAVLSMLDLLICVDTGLAHIAGAMGKPVWMMLPTPADYRWLTGRDDSPWYPALRLFRQPAPRQWEPVIARVARALEAWADAWPHGVAGERPRAATSAAPLERRIEGLAFAAETRAGFIQFVPDEPRVGRSLEHYGEWLEPQLGLALRLTRAGATIVEAGAGAGAHTLPLARATGAGGTLLAWERRPALRRLLAQNLAAHAIVQAAVMTRSLEGPDPRGFTGERETIDDLGLARLDGVKVNEGADAVAILAGAHDALWRCRPWIMASARDPGDLGRAREGLREFGYRAWRMVCPLFRPGNFNRRDDDVFGGERAIALVAIPEEVDVRDAPSDCVEWP
ncbi:hypothetical protein BURK1_01821 [Burkholderiales bacterium]|nr:hypothetical protein BURK1_01821 [Burkholderiales bacterium]